MLSRLSNRGDTIVEVLICLTISGFIFGVGYASANRSLVGMRTAQERSEALRIAETQLEHVKASGTSTSGRFCMKNDGTPSTGSFPASTLTDLETDSFTDYPAECRQGLYHVGIIGTIQGSGTVEYEVLTRWDGLTGNRNQVVLKYTVAQ